MKKFIHYVNHIWTHTCISTGVDLGSYVNWPGGPVERNKSNPSENVLALSVISNNKKLKFYWPFGQFEVNLIGPSLISLVAG